MTHTTPRFVQWIVRHIIRTKSTKPLKPGTYQATIKDVVVTADGQFLVQLDVGKRLSE